MVTPGVLGGSFSETGCSSGVDCVVGVQGEGRLDGRGSVPLLVGVSGGEIGDVLGRGRAGEVRGVD